MRVLEGGSGDRLAQRKSPASEPVSDLREVSHHLGCVRLKGEAFAAIGGFQHRRKLGGMRNE